MANSDGPEESKKESPHPTDYTGSTATGQPAVLNDSMQSKNGQPVKPPNQRSGHDNSQTRPATQSVPLTTSNTNAVARTTDNFYNASGAKSSVGS